jgi:oligosaccharide repeat unit polymerase
MQSSVISTKPGADSTYSKIIAILNVVLFSVSIFIFVTKIATPVVRLNLFILTFFLAILFSYWMFYLKNKGDIFAFINVLIFWYFIVFFMPLFLITYFPETRTKPAYWTFASLELAVFLIILSLYASISGYIFAGNTGSKWRLRLGASPSVKRIVIIIFVIGMLYLISVILRTYFMKTTLLNVLSFHSYATNFTKREYSMGVYTFTNILGSGVGYLFFLYLMLPKDRSTKNIIIWFTPVVFLFLIYSLIGAFLNTTKAVFFNFIFFIMVYYNYIIKKIRLFQIVVAFFCCMLILTSFNYRRMVGDMEKKLSLLNSVKFLYTQTFEDMETLAVVCNFFPNNHPYYNGKRTVEEILVLPIPRALWKDKPLAYGFRAIINDINPAWFSYGFHSGLQSQFYADFGIIGVIFGFFIFGALIRLVYNIFSEHKYNKGMVIFYICIISNSWLYLKGGFPWLSLAIASYIPLYLLLKYIYPENKYLEASSC